MLSSFKLEIDFTKATSPDESYVPFTYALSPQISFEETSKMDIAPLSLLSWGLGVVQAVLDVTYLCSIQAARMMAPAGPSFLLLKSASVMSVSTVTGSPSLPYFPPFPVNVILDNAPLALLAHCGCPNFQMSKFKLYMKAGRISNLICK